MYQITHHFLTASDDGDPVVESESTGAKEGCG